MISASQGRAALYLTGRIAAAARRRQRHIDENGSCAPAGIAQPQVTLQIRTTRAPGGGIEPVTAPGHSTAVRVAVLGALDGTCPAADLVAAFCERLRASSGNALAAPGTLTVEFVTAV